VIYTEITRKQKIPEIPNNNKVTKK